MTQWTREERLIYENRLLTELYKHPGPSRKIGMGELYKVVFQKSWNNRINDTRPLRRLIKKLTKQGVRIASSCSNTDGGYWLMTSASELDEKCQRLTSEGMKKLEEVSILRRIAMPELMGQLTLNLDMGAK